MAHLVLPTVYNSGIYSSILMFYIVTDFDTSLYLQSGIPTGKEEKRQILPGPIGKAECIQNSSRKPIPIQFFM